MNIHEYQAKALLKAYGITVPEGHVVASPDQAIGAAQELGGDVWMVKAQVHTGGRGKAGGVKRAATLEEVEKHTEQMLGQPLVTHQTGKSRKTVKRVLVEKGCRIDHEFYLGLVLDREIGKPVFMASDQGGMDIEAVAARTPERIVRAAVDPATGFTAYIGRKLAYGMGLRGDLLKQVSNVCKGLYELFIAKDCSLAEINPLVTTTTGGVKALDAKLNFDDNALFRQPDISALRDHDEEDPQETAASRYGLTYIGLDGNIGCLVNGAGLAMATMDILKLHGGEPANFLDAGGSATQEAIQEAFGIILAEQKVSAVLINIFGGILRCDIIARGVVSAARHLNVTVPIVVRLEGTNADMGRQILEGTQLQITVANDLADAAKKAVAQAGQWS